MLGKIGKFIFVTSRFYFKNCILPTDNNIEFEFWFIIDNSKQWRIQDFSQGGAPTPKSAIIFQFFAENCMKMKEFGPQGGRASLAPPLGSTNGKNNVHLMQMASEPKKHQRVQMANLT